MIYKTGNILEAKAEALVNTVNTVGIMGKGIALQIKNAYPDNYKIYSEAVKKGEVKIGQILVVPVNDLHGVKYILNFPTKAHWRFPSRISYIREGLKDLKEKLFQYNIHSVALPPLGCGSGGLNWKDVRKLIEDSLKDLNIDIIVYEPSEQLKEILKKQEAKKESHLTAPRAMLLYLLNRYRVLGEFASEFAAEKLSYFLQRFGEKQLRLDFQKGIYGPYSGKIRHVLYALNGKYIRGYEQKNTKPFEPLEIVLENSKEIFDYIQNKLSKEEKERLNKVEKLIDGFQSPYGLELLSTVDFEINAKKTFEAEKIFKAVSNWSNRKKGMFDNKHTSIAVRHLSTFKEELYHSLN